MKICLNTETYQKLLDHHPKESAGYSPLESAVKIDGGINTTDEYWIDCSEQEADAYLQIANTHFSNIVREIEYAIRTAHR
jgi:hypothetical protein